MERSLVFADVGSALFLLKLAIVDVFSSQHIVPQLFKSAYRTLALGHDVKIVYSRKIVANAGRFFGQICTSPCTRAPTCLAVGKHVSLHFRGNTS